MRMCRENYNTLMMPAAAKQMFEGLLLPSRGDEQPGDVEV